MAGLDVVEESNLSVNKSTKDIIMGKHIQSNKLEENPTKIE